MTDPTTPASTPDDRAVTAKAVRTLALSLMGAIVMIAVALLSVGLDDPWEANPITFAFLAVGLAVHVLVNTVIWPMTPAVEPGQDEAATFSAAMRGFQANMILRFAIIEAPMIAAVAAAFVVTSGGLTIFGVAAVVALALMWVHVYPNEVVVRRAQGHLEAKGARTGLAEVFGFSGHP